MTDQTPTSPGPSPAPRPGLTWGIKRSFVRYLSFLPDFRHAQASGASLVNGSFFHFEPADDATPARPARPDGGAPGSGAGPAAPLRFRGEVRLTGHRGMLVVVLADPWVEHRDGRTVLTVVDHRPDGEGRMPLAALEPAAVPVSSLRWTARLTDAAGWFFNDQYPAGEELDAVEVVLPA